MVRAFCRAIVSAGRSWSDSCQSCGRPLGSGANCFRCWEEKQVESAGEPFTRIELASQRYYLDPGFRSVVESLRVALVAQSLSIAELQDALKLATIKAESGLKKQTPEYATSAEQDALDRLRRDEALRTRHLVKQRA